MKSQLLQLREQHENQVEELRKTCEHKQRWITIRHDKSAVGCGSLYGCVVVTCCNCGTQKIIWELDSKEQKTVKKQLTRQGFKDERLDCSADYDWELRNPNMET